MADFVPTFKLYDYSDALVYTFSIVQYTNAPKPFTRSVLIEGLRGQGGIVIPGSDGVWDLIIKGIFTGDDYEELVVKMDEIETDIEYHTRYKLKIEKSISEVYEYNVKRIDPIEYSESLRNYSQEYQITFKVNVW